MTLITGSKKLRVLIACEFSGIVREAFRARGHDAVSCDLLPTERPGPHIQGDVLEHLEDGWDMMIAFPPCTYLTVTGNKWMKDEFRSRFPNRLRDRVEAIRFFVELWLAPIEKIAIENPIGIMSSVLRSPDQIVQPCYFGDAERKTTCLWLKGLSPLRHLGKKTMFEEATHVEPELYTYQDGRTDGCWHVKTMSLPAEERMKERSRTFPGIANAMAEQWGSLTKGG